MLVGMGGVGVVAIAVLLGVAAFVSGAFDSLLVAESDDAVAVAQVRSPETTTVGADSNAHQDKRNGNASSNFGAPGGTWNVFVLNLGDRERDEVQVRIDGEEQEVPELGPIMYPLSAGEHRLTLTREGFDPIEHRFEMAENGRQTYRPAWQMAGSGDIASNFPKLGENAPASDLSDWLQDFEAAKRRAAAENKDILIAFNGSDWCIWCVRLMNEVLFQREFREQIEEDFVLVSIDVPREAEARAKVQDRARNEAMTERFAVSSYPTIVLTDSQGQAYAEGGYVDGGVEPFMREIAQLQRERAERDRLFAAVTRASGEDRLEAAEEAFEWLRDNGFIQHYGRTLQKWMQLAQRDDPTNEKGQYEVFFEMDWLARFAAADRSDLRGLRPLFTRLEEFNRNCEFQDGDRGGRLNLIAAG